MTASFKTIALSLGIALLFFSCGENKKEASSNTVSVPDTTQNIPVKEDTVITKIRPALFDLENKELSFSGRKPFDLTISDIQYKFISLKEYYTDQQAALSAQAKYSTNKEKTDKALGYLVKMIQGSGTKPELYKVQFHLKAKVDKTVYDEQKILYLKNDLTLLELIFP